MSRLCAWCPKAPGARRSGSKARRASHGICPPCLTAGLRGERSGYVRSGARFYVWDDDARAGAAWAAELPVLDTALTNRARRANG